LPYLVRRHIADCQRILLGLLAAQVAPIVDKKPAEYKWEPVPAGKPRRGLFG
jgi:hypothetical protein